MMVDVGLNDTSRFALFIGKRRLKEELFGRNVGVPLYSANVKEPFGLVEQSNVTDFSNDHVLWGIDGDFMFNVVHKGTPFATTDHCGAIRILDSEIVPEYLMYQLEVQGHVLGFDRGLRASLANMRRVRVRLPVLDDGAVDRQTQLALVEKYIAVRDAKRRLREEADALETLMVEIPQIGPALSLTLGDLFDLSLTTNRSDFTKRFVNDHPGPIPVYSASGDEHEAGYGYVADNLPGIKYFENILTWNIDGSRFRAFHRRERFSLSEKVIPLVLRPEWAGKIDYDFVRHLIDRKALESGAAYQNKPGKGRIKNLELDIPAKLEGESLVPDPDRQRETAAKYQDLYRLKRQIIDMLRTLSNSFVDV
jgi:hypothetical protein